MAWSVVIGEPLTARVRRQIHITISKSLLCELYKNELIDPNDMSRTLNLEMLREEEKKL